ncbi:MAG TPA: extracellular solute-binding protein [Tepidisphaeraceae bacterium]|jgi:ABC-type glycerol-3-phosphate transport system substrate-binding protein
MRTIRRFILVAMILAGVGFVAFGSGDKPAPAPPGATVVTYWEKWTGAEAEQMRQIVDAFNATVGREKNIFVRYLSMANIDQKTLVSVSAGVPPDIAGIWDQQVAQYAALGAIEPLDELAAAHGINGDTFLPAYWDACHYEGRLYSLISAPATVAMVYNKALMRENAEVLRAAGCDPERPPATIEELDRYARALDTHAPDGHLDRAGFMPMQSWFVQFTGFWFGDAVYDRASGRFTLDSPESVRAFEWIKSYSDRLGTRAVQDFNTSHVMANFDSPQNPMLTGKLVMQQHGPWVAEYFARNKPSMSQVRVPKSREHELADRTDNYAWAIAPFPSASGPSGAGRQTAYCMFDALVIPSGARHKAEAFAFIAYLSRQNVAEQFARLHCTNSPLRNVSQDFFDRHPNPYIRVFQDLAAGPGARSVPPVPIWPEVVKELTDATQAVALQGAEPAAVLRAAQARLQGKLDGFNRTQRMRRPAAAQ